MVTRRPLRRGAAIVVVGALALLSAHAASMGGLATASVLAVDHSGGSGAPDVIGCDDFTGVNGSSLHLRVATATAACAGRAWSVHAGAWRLSANRAAPNSTTNAVVTLNTAQPDASVQVDLNALSSGSRRGGVVLAADGAGRYLAALAVNGSPDRVELKVVTPTSTTTVATVTTNFVSPVVRLRATRSGADVTVTVDGASILSHTLSNAHQAVLTGGRTGLIGGSSQVRFDDLVVTSP